jgi:hypothetical protein
LYMFKTFVSLLSGRASYQLGPDWIDFREFHIADFYENLSRKSKFGLNRTKTSDT